MLILLPRAKNELKLLKPTSTKSHTFQQVLREGDPKALCRRVLPHQSHPLAGTFNSHNNSYWVGAF